MKIIISESQVDLIKEQLSATNDNTNIQLTNGTQNLTDRLGKIKKYILEVPDGKGGFRKKEYYYLGGGESMFDEENKTSSLKNKVYSPEECSEAVSVYKKRVDAKKYYEGLLKEMGFSSPETFSLFLKRIEKLSYDEQEEWFNSSEGMKINKMKNNFYWADGKKFNYFSLENGKTYNNLKGVHRINGENLKPQKFVFINVDEGGVWFYPVFEPQVPKCLVPGEGAIPKINSLKNRIERDRRVVQTEPPKQTQQLPKGNTTYDSSVFGPAKSLIGFMRGRDFIPATGQYLTYMNKADKELLNNKVELNKYLKDLYMGYANPVD